MLHFLWEWRLQAPPDKLWPMVSDTDRFNRDVGMPPYLSHDPVSPGPGGADGPGRSIAIRKFGLTLRWLEEPFEWARPHRYGVTRMFLTGPLLGMKVSMAMATLPEGGTRLRYEISATPRNALWAIPARLAFRFIARRRFEAVFRRYDRAAMADRPTAPAHVERTFAPGGKARLSARFRDLLEAGAEPTLAARLRLLLEDGDDQDLARMRPYALAGIWRAGRRDVLELFLLAARSGLLDFRWDLLCPSCRGSKATFAHLRDLKGPVHCDSCHIDFRAAFDRSVEVTFTPNPAIRARETAEYCMGSPQNTPHVHCRHNLEPNTAATFDLALDPGRYRLRSPSLPGAWHIRVTPEGDTHAHAEPPPDGWPRGEAEWNVKPRLSLANPTARRIQFVLERMAWTDDAATAAEVTALQSFRDLFSEEALRPGEEISVGSLAFLFTDLRGSTRLYREAGDAKAFGLVMEHFDILRSAIAAEGGAVVKTIGDAVMAVFPRPQAAVRAAMESHRRLAEAQPLLVLKAGVHCGSCIAVNQNDRLDYFGSTLNLAARLLGFSAGGDVVVTREIGDDPETSAWLAAHASECMVEGMEVPIRGFEKQAYSLLRLSPGQKHMFDVQK